MARIGGQKVPVKTVVMIVSDSVLIFCGLFLATSIRFLNDYWSAQANLHEQGHIWRFAFVALVCELSLYFHDVYNADLAKNHDQMTVRIVRSLGTAFLGLAVIYYLRPQLGLGRGIAALAAVLITALIITWRLVVDRTRFFRKPERVLILGTDPTGITLVREILRRPNLHYKVVGFLDEKGQNIGKSLVNPGIIGATDNVTQIVEQEKIERVILSLSERRGCTPVRQLLQLKFAGVDIQDAHTCYEQVTGRILLERLSPSWLILSDGFHKTRLRLAAKRALDLLVALILLAIFLPVMLVVALAIWMESGGPVLFRQTRVGLGGSTFEILKFRSMVQDAEADGPQWAVQGDARVTQVGKVIRKYRLDELPQLFNVLRGEMSLVGPRPERPHFCALLEPEMPIFDQRHSVRPGVTGWAQVWYPYGSSIEDAKAKLEHDLFYIKNLSLTLDLLIIFETVKVVLSQRGAR